MEIYRFFSDTLSSVFNCLASFFMGKKVKENEILRAQNQKMQQQIQIAACPDKSWDALLEWLRSQ